MIRDQGSVDDCRSSLASWLRKPTLPNNADSFADRIRCDSEAGDQLTLPNAFVPGYRCSDCSAPTANSTVYCLLYVPVSARHRVKHSRSFFSSRCLPINTNWLNRVSVFSQSRSQ